MKIAFVHTQKSFLPELSAYTKHLQKAGHKTITVLSENDLFSLRGELDLIFRFAGFLRGIQNLNLPEIHNYNSASTGKLPIIKNIIKSLTSSKPAGRIFLNEIVKSSFYFNDGAPYIFRDMGADESFFKSRSRNIKLYDLVYCGSIVGRPGLIEELSKLSKTGFKIGLAGNASNEQYKIIKKLKNIDFVGSIKYDTAADFISQGRFGLNYCPDIYPFNIQTSTKVIEYLAAGIGIVSNNYLWINNHSKKYNYDYIELNKISNPSCLDYCESSILNEKIARQFEWDNLLSECGFSKFLEDTYKFTI